MPPTQLDVPLTTSSSSEEAGGDVLARPNTAADPTTSPREDHWLGYWTSLRATSRDESDIINNRRSYSEDVIEFYTDDDDEPAPSSWQEEAHWMSFRNAVLQYMRQHRHEKQKRIVPVTGARQVSSFHNNEDDNSTTSCSSSDEDEDDSGWMTRWASRQQKEQEGRTDSSPLRSTVGAHESSKQKAQSTQPREQDDEPPPPVESIHLQLALAQAERDAMEFELMKQHVNRNA